MTQSALIILHPGFEEMEAIAPIDILRRGDVRVTVASIQHDLVVTGRSGIQLVCDQALSAVSENTFDAIILPGGPGTYKYLRNNPALNQIITEHHSQQKLIAAICAAPLVLWDLGLLKNKRFTAHTSTLEEMPTLDTSESVIQEGNILTSRGAGTATAFALAILAHLTSSTDSENVAQSICLTTAQ